MIIMYQTTGLNRLIMNLFHWMVSSGIMFLSRSKTDR